MPIIFQNFRHLFLELFFAEAAPKVRYSYYPNGIKIKVNSSLQIPCWYKNIDNLQLLIKKFTLTT